MASYVHEAPQRRCRAYHPNGLQCEGEASEATSHVEDHWATIASGNVLRWDDSVAVPGPTVEARQGQVGGDHYRKFKIQPWDIWEEYGLDPWLANCVKYLLRAGRKGPKVEDLKKARHYLDRAIERAIDHGPDA